MAYAKVRKSILGFMREPDTTTQARGPCYSIRAQPMSIKKSGGTGFQPVSSFKITRRNLPHWQEPERIYFLTWRCAKEQGLSPEERTTVLEAVRYWDNRKWTVYAAVVMPNHVHALVQPLIQSKGGSFDLAGILHSVKSFSAH